jgi:hypothetical protein
MTVKFGNLCDDNGCLVAAMLSTGDRYYCDWLLGEDRYRDGDLRAMSQEELAEIVREHDDYKRAAREKAREDIIKAAQKAALDPDTPWKEAGFTLRLMQNRCYWWVKFSSYGGGGDTIRDAEDNYFTEFEAYSEYGTPYSQCPDKPAFTGRV